MWPLLKDKYLRQNRKQQETRNFKLKKKHYLLQKKPFLVLNVLGPGSNLQVLRWKANKIEK